MESGSTLYINNENNEINKSKNLKENLKRRLLIVPVIVIGLAMFFLPADLFFWFILALSTIIIIFGVIELFDLQNKRKRFIWKADEESFLVKYYWVDMATTAMIFYFAIAILLFFFFASGIKEGNGQSWYLLMLAPAGMQDAIAYGLGVTIGKHKIRILKNVSSNKTWEGTFFGIIAGFSLAMIILEFDFSYLQFWQKTFTALVIATCAFFGDLLESKFKRFLKIKDSGTIMKGHGGLLDRIDSQLLAIYGISALALFWFL